MTGSVAPRVSNVELPMKKLLSELEKTSLFNVHVNPARSNLCKPRARLTPVDGNILLSNKGRGKRERGGGDVCS